MVYGESNGHVTTNQGSFPAATPGNDVPKVILAVGTAFPGKPLVIHYIFVNEP